MRRSLIAHPSLECKAVACLNAEALRPKDGLLTLRYRLTGEIGAIVLPEPRPAVRADALWRHTCFEAFVRAGREAGYVEFNFAPSGEWNAYKFSDYRKDMEAAQSIAAPVINVSRTGGEIEMQVLLDLAGLRLRHDALWSLGLSAVIEDKNGELSYWALAHPTGEPDFHHSDCFAVELAPPSRP